MPCITCARPAPGAGGLCPRCRSGLTPASDVVLDGAFVTAAFVHSGTARRLVHLLKYAAIPAAARPLAAAMAEHVGDVSAIVAVPRVRLRTWRYGIDPAEELARALARITGRPLLDALDAGWWHPRRAGGSGGARGTPAFRVITPVPIRALLVDDVVTTGTTLGAAHTAIGRPVRAVAATLAPTFRTGCSGYRVPSVE